MVAAAALLSAVAVAQAPQVQVALVFVLPVLISATLWGLRPALAAAFLGAAAFDFFFTTPQFTFSMERPADVITLLLLLIVAGVTSWSAAKARRSALQAKSAARRAQSLHELARGALGGADEPALLHLARCALEENFEVPAVVLKARGESVTAFAGNKPALLSYDDQDAARWAINNGKPVRAASYPYFGSRFDIWPIPGRRLAFGLQFGLSDEGRPENPEELIDLVSGYVVGAKVGRQ